MILFHGSNQIIEQPKLGKGKAYNDYGPGFYCTENLDLAKEWACPLPKDGFANQYELNINGLFSLNLSDNRYHILNWLALLLENRTFDITASLALQAREYIIQTFMPELKNIDYIIGYRADDSYFSFAEDFVSGSISLRDLNEAMHLGALGEQAVLISPCAFNHLQFVKYEISSHQEYHIKRVNRDYFARQQYQDRKRDLKSLKEDLFVLDILREEMKNDDPRIQ
ncbi:MAG TPA: hypothetical protein DCM45_00240 [Clostridiales bacterium]|nr:hypothetical protein [Clostridiales bacterium]